MMAVPVHLKWDLLPFISKAGPSAACWEPSAKLLPCHQPHHLPKASAISSEGRQAATSHSPSRLAIILIFFLCLSLSFIFLPFFLSISLSLLLSRSKCLHFLQQTVSRGTRVYFATCGDGSLPRQELAASCYWFLTCVHPFTSRAVRSSLLPPKDLQGSSPFKGHVEAFDIMGFIGLRGAVWVLFENVRKYNKSTKTTLRFLSGT